MQRGRGRRGGRARRRQAQAPSQCLQHALRDPAHVSTLQAGVVRSAHAGQDGDLLAAQAGYAPTAVGAQPRLLGRDPGASRGEELADFLLGLHGASVNRARALGRPASTSLTGTPRSRDPRFAESHPRTGGTLMKHISLGGLEVSRIGLGTMAMSGYYLDPSSSDAESIRTIRRASSWASPTSTPRDIRSLRQRGTRRPRLKGRRDDVVVATKFGFVSHSGAGPGTLDSRPANIRTAVEGSLTRLGTDRIDLYYQHQVDRTRHRGHHRRLGRAGDEGKVLHIGLSEAGPKRSAALTPCNRSGAADRVLLWTVIQRPSCFRCYASLASVVYDGRCLARTGDLHGVNVALCQLS